MADTTDSKQSAVIQDLQLFDVPEVAARIYLHISTNPPLSIIEISKQLGIPRTTTYDNVDILIRMKLAERIETYKSHKIKAYPIDALASLVEKQQTTTQLLEKTYEKLKQSLTVIPSVTALTEVRYYQATQGLEQMVWNSLKSKGDLIGFTTYGRRNIVGSNFYKRYIEEFMKKGISDQVITNPTPETMKYIKKYVLPKGIHQQSHTPHLIRYLPKSAIDISGDTMIYNDTFSVAYWESGEVVGVEIENHEFVKTQRSIFLTLWKQAKPIKELL
jgi:sugar-specific transcriptional regulator TrmB